MVQLWKAASVYHPASAIAIHLSGKVRQILAKPAVDNGSGFEAEGISSDLRPPTEVDVIGRCGVRPPATESL